MSKVSGLPSKKMFKGTGVGNVNRGKIHNIKKI